MVNIHPHLRHLTIFFSSEDNQMTRITRYACYSIWLVCRPARPTTSWLSTSVYNNILKVRFEEYFLLKILVNFYDLKYDAARLGEACWWTVHPASKQRSEGEKVRVGDDLILVSVATERYLVSNSLHR